MAFELASRMIGVVETQPTNIRATPNSALTSEMVAAPCFIPVALCAMHISGFCPMDWDLIRSLHDGIAI